MLPLGLQNTLDYLTDPNRFGSWLFFVSLVTFGFALAVT